MGADQFFDHTRRDGVGCQREENTFSGVRKRKYPLSFIPADDNLSSLLQTRLLGTQLLLCAVVAKNEANGIPNVRSIVMVVSSQPMGQVCKSILA